MQIGVSNGAIAAVEIAYHLVCQNQPLAGLWLASGVTNAA
jgi:hypothetical protein